MSTVVNILLSTYNGEKYLGELFQSLTNQSYPFIKITIRDDGSSDNTISIIESFAGRNNNIQFIEGQNLGAIKSFFTLLKEADSSGYYAFCDQDDVWHPDKIERAVDAINRYPVSRPVMYCSAYTLVDENLKPIGRTWKAIKKPGFANALVENIATGCTIVINQAARAELIKKLPSNNVLMHDWWIYLVISALGEVIYDATPSILYRQHSSNVVGAKADIGSELIHRVKKYRNRDDFKLISKQVSEFYQLYKSEMDNKTLKITEKFLNDRFFNRVKNILRGTFYRQSIIDNLFFKILYFHNKI